MPNQVIAEVLSNSVPPLGQLIICGDHPILPIFPTCDITILVQNSYSLLLGQMHTYGSSEVGILICQIKNGKLEVIYADTIKRPSFTEAVHQTQELIEIS